MTQALVESTWQDARLGGLKGAIQRATNQLVLHRLLMLANNVAADADVRAIALDSVNSLDNWLSVRVSRETETAWRAHYSMARQHIRRAYDDPSTIEQMETVTVPPGSPIGGGY